MQQNATLCATSTPSAARCTTNAILCRGNPGGTRCAAQGRESHEYQRTCVTWARTDSLLRVARVGSAGLTRMLTLLHIAVCIVFS